MTQLTFDRLDTHRARQFLNDDNRYLKPLRWRRRLRQAKLRAERLYEVSGYSEEYDRWQAFLDQLTP